MARAREAAGVPADGTRAKTLMSSLNDRLKTDVDRYRLRFSVGPRGVVFAWDYPGSELLRVRIVRADNEAGEPPAAPSAAPSGPPSDPPDDSPWRVVYEGVTGSFRDAGVTVGASWRYAVFARLGDEPWTLWRAVRLLIP